jgi:hypothetical protein
MKMQKPVNLGVVDLQGEAAKTNCSSKIVRVINLQVSWLASLAGDLKTVATATLPDHAEHSDMVIGCYMGSLLSPSNKGALRRVAGASMLNLVNKIKWNEGESLEEDNLHIKMALFVVGDASDDDKVLIGRTLSGENNPLGHHKTADIQHPPASTMALMIIPRNNNMESEPTPPTQTLVPLRAHNDENDKRANLRARMQLAINITCGL